MSTMCPWYLTLLWEHYNYRQVWPKVVNFNSFQFFCFFFKQNCKICSFLHPLAYWNDFTPNFVIFGSKMAPLKMSHDVGHSQQKLCHLEEYGKGFLLSALIDEKPWGGVPPPPSFTVVGLWIWLYVWGLSFSSHILRSADTNLWIVGYKHTNYNKKRYHTLRN